MRLRQIALAARELSAITGALGSAFGMKVAFEDPGIIHYGLRNAVLPAGGEFIEVLSPVRGDSSGARFLARRGGDAGYMLILQTADAEAERARIAALGVRVVDDIDRRDYRASHYHPNDFGGILTSIDQQRTADDPLERLGDWWPAGPDWRSAVSGETTGLAAAVLASPDPDALARRFSELLDRPLTDGRRLELERGTLRFVAGEADHTVLAGIDLEVASRARCLERARAAGLDVDESGVLIGGVRFQPLD